mgnify:FL=1
MTRIKLTDINFINYDNVEINNRINNDIINNVQPSDLPLKEIEVILFKNVKSYVYWLMIDDIENITTSIILRNGFKFPNKTFKQIIQDQFIKDDMRVSQLENGMILFQYE